MNYVVTHCHSDLSNGVTNVDSVTKYDDYINRAKELGMKAFAFTEHGNVFSWVNKKAHIEKAGMKYIHAAEFYVTEKLFEDTDEKKKIRDNYHCCLYAKNYDGVLELNKLSSKSFNRQDGHFYYTPRITLDELIATSDNIMVSTACLGGILHKGNDNVKKVFIEFLKANKHRCFLEIQHHNVEEQIEYNRELFKLSKEIGVPLIVGTDTHALNDKHLKGRKILQLAKKVHFGDEDSWDLTFKSYEELVEAYKIQNSLPMDIVLQAIENTNVLADRVEEFKMDYSYKYPHLWKDSEGTFQQKIQEGIITRGVEKYPNYQEYLDRIEDELKAYRHNGAIDFMLLMADIIDWCTDNDIRIGYGRGSCNGSVIAWLLGITEMDSIKHKLNFSRFMNTERVSLSDIDSDLPPSRIDDVKEYIFSRHGLYCSDIITFNTIADKGAIRDVGRALEIPLDEVSNICDSFDANEKKCRKNNKELFEYVDIVKGTIVSIGTHPCGLIVSPYPVDDKLATCSTSTDDYPISQIYMKEIDGLNYVKLDLLRLDTIEIINETCKLANIPRLTPDNLDIDDIDVWNSMRDDTTGIFQWEGSTGNDYIKKLLSDENIAKFQKIDKNVNRMTLLSIGNSAIRPAGASYRDDLANGVVRSSGSKEIDEFLKSTFGYLVFQCQIIDFLHEYCGFTMGEADIVRRHFAKKTGTENDIPVIKDGGYMKNADGTDKTDHYIDGFIATMKAKYNMGKEDAEKAIITFLQVIIDASNYLFSLNHSQPYSYEGYACGWLRYYYPVEFLTCDLNVNKDKEKKTKALTSYCKKIGISIRSPKFRYSKAEYFCDRKNRSIYKGIGSIKYLNATIADELYKLKDNIYDTFVDLLIDIQNKVSIDVGQLHILIKLNFFSEFGDINYLLKCVEYFNLLKKIKQLKKDKLQQLNISESIVRAFADKETDTRVEEIDCLAFISSIGLDEDSLCDCARYKKVDGERVMNGYSAKLVQKKFNVPDDVMYKYATKIVYGQFSQLDNVAIIKKICSQIENNKTRDKDLIAYQLEYLGYIDITGEQYKGFYVVTDLVVKGTPKISAYVLLNGNTTQIKIDKKTFAKQPLKRGDIIKLHSAYKKNKVRPAKKDENGKVLKWEETDEKEWWTADYSVV